MQAVHFRPGGPENLYLADVPLPELWSKHVHLRVIGTAINRADLLQRKGLYPPPQGTTNILGLEATGEIWPPPQGVTNIVGPEATGVC